MDGNMKLIIEIKNEKPVELADLVNCMNAIDKEYNSHLRNNYHYMNDNKVSLYINEVKQGSIIASLVAMGVGNLPLIDHVNTIFDFGENLIIILSWLAGQRGEPEVKPDKQTLNNVLNMMEVSAKDAGSSLGIKIENNGTIINNYYANSNESNTIQNRARRELELQKEPVSGFYEKALMHWGQTRNQPTNSRGDKAIIERVSSKPVNVIFDNGLKNETFFNLEHPFSKGFVVDAWVETVDGDPKLYRVTRLHEIMDIE